MCSIHCIIRWLVDALTQSVHVHHSYNYIQSDCNYVMAYCNSSFVHITH